MPVTSIIHEKTALSNLFFHKYMLNCWILNQKSADRFSNIKVVDTYCDLYNTLSVFIPSSISLFVSYSRLCDLRAQGIHYSYSLYLVSLVINNAYPACLNIYMSSTRCFSGMVKYFGEKCGVLRVTPGHPSMSKTWPRYRTSTAVSIINTVWILQASIKLNHWVNTK